MEVPFEKSLKHRVSQEKTFQNLASTEDRG